MKKGFLFILLFWLFHILIWCSEKLGYVTAESCKKNADYYANADKKWYHKLLGL